MLKSTHYATAALDRSAKAPNSTHFVNGSIATTTYYSPPGPTGRSLVIKSMHQVANGREALDRISR